MMTNRMLIDEFVRKHMLGREDKCMQLDCIQEELAELICACALETEPRELEEAVDTLVTLFVYLRMLGFSWDEIGTEFNRKISE